MSLVERRYAEALAELAPEQSDFEALRTEFDFIISTLGENADFDAFLKNPQVTPAKRKEVIHNVFSANIRPELLNFLKLLVDKGRIVYLPGIAEEFRILADKKQKILNITIVSALPVSTSQVDSIKEKYRRLYDASGVKAKLKTDRELLGGIKVIIGDKVIDGTVKARLESLKETLM